MAWIFSVIAAICGTYWDLVVDWGLLQRQSKNRWLRDKLLIPYKSVYFGAMVSKYWKLWNSQHLEKVFQLKSNPDNLRQISWNTQVLNVLLRFAWLQTVLNFQVSFLHREAMIAIFASLEIIRRGIWNFFRYLSGYEKIHLWCILWVIFTLQDSHRFLIIIPSVEWSGWRTNIWTMWVHTAHSSQYHYPSTMMRMMTKMIRL